MFLAVPPFAPELIVLIVLPEPQLEGEGPLSFVVVTFDNMVLGDSNNFYTFPYGKYASLSEQGENFLVQACHKRPPFVPLFPLEAGVCFPKGCYPRRALTTNSLKLRVDPFRATPPLSSGLFFRFPPADPPDGAVVTASLSAKPFSVASFEALGLFSLTTSKVIANIHRRSSSSLDGTPSARVLFSRYPLLPGEIPTWPNYAGGYQEEARPGGA